MQIGEKVAGGIGKIGLSGKMVQAAEPLLLVVALLSVAVLGGCTGVVSASKSPDPVTGTFQISPASINFGNIVVGKQGSQTITISNTGTSSVTLTQATVSNSQFTIGGMSLPMTMAVGQTGSFTVGVKPTATGTVTGTLTVQGDSGSEVVNLSATVLAATPQISLSSSSVNFGSVTVGSSAPTTLTISNTGNADLTVSAISIAGSGFGVSGFTTPKVISAGQSSPVSLTFGPSATGTATGTLTITSSDPTNPTLHVSLSGTGAAAPVGTLQPNQTSLSFGNVSTGSNQAKQVVLTNTGTSAVQITGVGVTGTGFTVSGVNTPVTVNPSSQVTLTVTFAPTTAGNASGTISITSNASGSPLSITASGTGVQPGISVSPTSFNFGSVVDGQTKSQTFTVTNSGTTYLTISQLSISAAGYSVSGLSVPSTVAPGNSVSFSAVFTPTTAGNLTGTINIGSNAPNSPTTVALSGTGVAQTFTVSFSSTSLSFGNVNTGTSVTQNETITNTGNSNVQISQIKLTGSGYSLSGASVPVTLSPAQKLTFGVIFDPTTAGSAAGSVQVTSNATGSPATISISGTGVAAVSHTVGLNWVASPTSGVSGYNVYRSTTSGGSYVKINVSPVSAVNYTDSSVQNGTTYYYVTTAIDSSGDESVYSNEASAVIP